MPYKTKDSNHNMPSAVRLKQLQVNIYIRMDLSEALYNWISGVPWIHQWTMCAKDVFITILFDYVSHVFIICEMKWSWLHNESFFW